MWELDYKKILSAKELFFFELWCWRRLLRVPWIARRSNQSILKEISTKYSLEGLMLKLKLQYFGHLMWKMTYWKRPWCWERLKSGGEQDNRGWDGWMASLTRWTWVWGPHNDTLYISQQVRGLIKLQLRGTWTDHGPSCQASWQRCKVCLQA